MKQKEEALHGPWSLEESTHYAVLGVDERADLDTIKRAYHKAARQHHPDRQQSDASTDPKFIRIHQAWRVLSSKAERSVYDHLLAVGRQRYNSKQLGAIKLHPDDCRMARLDDNGGYVTDENDEGEDYEAVCIYTCRCGHTIEIDEDVVECKTCSLVYDAGAIASDAE